MASVLPKPTQDYRKLFKIQEKHGRGGESEYVSGIENTQIIEKASCSKRPKLRNWA